MKKRKKSFIIIGVFFVVIAAIAVFPVIRIETSRIYFDINNGRLKTQKIFLKQIYQESIENTDYSQMLKTHEFPELDPEWKLAYIMQNWVSPWRCGRTWKVYNFTNESIELIQLQNNALKERDHINKLRIMVQDENADDIYKFNMMLLDNLRIGLRAK